MTDEKVIVVNEVVDEMYKNWVSGWIRFDAGNSFEEPAEFTNKADFNALWKQVEGRGECVSFYRCPLCGGVSNNPLAHTLDAHRDTVRVWNVSGEYFNIYFPGEGGYNPFHRASGPKPAEAIRRFLKHKATFAELCKVVA